jgi:hypothetical protein
MFASSSLNNIDKSRNIMETTYYDDDDYEPLFDESDYTYTYTYTYTYKYTY